MKRNCFRTTLVAPAVLGAVLSCFASARAQTTDPDLIVFDNFDKGQLLQSLGGLWGNDCLGKVTTDVKLSGNYSYLAENTDFKPCFYYDLGNINEVYMRLYWYFPRNFDFVRVSGGGHAWRFYTPSFKGQLDTALGKIPDPISSASSRCGDNTYFGNWMGLWFTFTDGGGAYYESIHNPTPTEFPGFLIEKWNRLELYVKLNTPGAADGTLRYWVNDKPVFEKTRVNLRGNSSESFSTFAIMTNFSAYGFGCPTRPHHWYYDDVMLKRKVPADAFKAAGTEPGADTTAPAAPNGLQQKP